VVVVVIMPLLVLLLLPIFLNECANGATDGDDELVVFGGGAGDDASAGSTVLGIPHMRASVVLTTLRLGLPGLHIFALISGDIALLGELAVDSGNIVGGEEIC
jgi:hypothetical protein